MSTLDHYIAALLFASCLMTVASAYGPNGGTAGASSAAGDSISAFASASSNSLGPFRLTQDQISGQLSALQTGDMVLINGRRFVAVRGDGGQTSAMILIEAADDSYTLDAKLRDSVSHNLNAKSDGYSAQTSSASGELGRQNIVGGAPTLSGYSTPTQRQSVTVEASASSSSPGFGAPLNSPASYPTRKQATSVAERDQHAYSSVSANGRPASPPAKKQAADDGAWDYSESIPGVAGVDYPTFAEVPSTSFSCAGRHEGGYYADVDARCQVYHVCALNEKKFSFLCPNGTLFNQQSFVCEWWNSVNCADSREFYALNFQIGSTTLPSVSALGASLASSPVVQQAAGNVRPSYGVPPVQQPVVQQPFDVRPIAQPVTIEQTVKPTYGAPKPQQPFIQPVVIQQSNTNKPSFGLNPPPVIQASVAASAY